jgi:hypothetical protein
VSDNLRLVVDEDGGRTFGDGIGNEARSVSLAAGDGGKDKPWTDLAAVGGDTGNSTLPAPAGAVASAPMSEERSMVLLELCGTQRLGYVSDFHIGQPGRRQTPMPAGRQPLPAWAAYQAMARYEKLCVPSSERR